MAMRCARRSFGGSLKADGDEMIQVCAGEGNPSFIGSFDFEVVQDG